MALPSSSSSLAASALASTSTSATYPPFLRALIPPRRAAARRQARAAPSGTSDTDTEGEVDDGERAPTREEQEAARLFDLVHAELARRERRRAMYAASSARAASIALEQALEQQQAQSRSSSRTRIPRSAARDIASESARAVSLDEHLYRAQQAGLRALEQSTPGAGLYSAIRGGALVPQIKNRYSNIVPYDATRLRVRANRPGVDQRASAEKREQQEEEVDERIYLNASVVREPLQIAAVLGAAPDEHSSSSGARASASATTAVTSAKTWIAMQAPLQQTVHDFWLAMLKGIHGVERGDEVALVVQLTCLVENGREKCSPYFPREVGREHAWRVEPEPVVAPYSSSFSQPSSAPPLRAIHIELLAKSLNATDGSRQSHLRAWFDGDDPGSTARQVTHVEYRGWRDYGVPDDPRQLARFIARMHDLNASLSRSSATSEAMAPICVHCSAGVGRTGTLIALSCITDVLRSLWLSGHHHADDIDGMFDARKTADYERQRVMDMMALAGGAAKHPLGPIELPPELGFDPVALVVDALRDQRCMMVQSESQLLWLYEALALVWHDLSSSSSAST